MTAIVRFHPTHVRPAIDLQHRRHPGTDIAQTSQAIAHLIKTHTHTVLPISPTSRKILKADLVCENIIPSHRNKRRTLREEPFDMRLPYTLCIHRRTKL